MGFEEIAHTADWSVRVWARDLPSLFAEAVRAMNSLAGTAIVEDARVKRTFESQAPDAESLLVAFLSELVYYQEQENLAFDVFKLEIKSATLTVALPDRAWRHVPKGQKLKVAMEGAQITSIDKAIKAVTYHNMKIEETSRGIEVVIVFDV
ncbi:MAG TPA: archease [Anaerolineales bacterium]|nr:archease [Anaerolineales bacterium]